MPRQIHQEGWVALSGKRVKRWVGHWMPYKADGKRTHTTVPLGEKAGMLKWQVEAKLRDHIAKGPESQAGRRPDVRVVVEQKVPPDARLEHRNRNQHQMYVRQARAARHGPAKTQ